LADDSLNGRFMPERASQFAPPDACRSAAYVGWAFVVTEARQCFVSPSTARGALGHLEGEKQNVSKNISRLSKPAKSLTSLVLLGAASTSSILSVNMQEV